MKELPIKSEILKEFKQNSPAGLKTNVCTSGCIVLFSEISCKNKKCIKILQNENRAM
jgi:hypothetical protein